LISFLFITSFLIHIITIYALVQFYFKYESLKKTESRETIELMETYLQEIKEENNRLQALINNSHQLKSSNTTNKEDNIRQPVNQKIEEANNNLNYMNDFSFFDNNINDTIEASLEAKVLQLHNEGLSITDIARKLHCGKTEAELIINLNKKNRNNS